MPETTQQGADRLTHVPLAILVVMRLANMRRVHPRQDDSRACSRCGERVGIYPSGQQVLAAHPDIAIVCEVCIERRDIDIAFLAPGAKGEAFESVPVDDADRE